MLEKIKKLCRDYIVDGDHGKSNYFDLIKKLVAEQNKLPEDSEERAAWKDAVHTVYRKVEDELTTNQGVPISPVNFGTSGWRGILGKDLFVKSLEQVTMAVVSQYYEMDNQPELIQALGVSSLEEARKNGAVVGFDNRFGGEILAARVVDVLTSNGFVVHYAGEATTGTLSAAVLQLGAAFSINLTPSHNPLEYGGFKYNAADGGPAAAILTSGITAQARKNIAGNLTEKLHPDQSLVKPCDALALWLSLVRQGQAKHGLDYDEILASFQNNKDMLVVVDCVHGASRVHIDRLLPSIPDNRLVLLRATVDQTFGGIAPEPSTNNMMMLVETLNQRPERLKLGVIIDPDGDRIRFTDGRREITMNHFGAMAYDFLHEKIGKSGLVAKTVATSNFANKLAASFGEEVFETRVGFKEFKPVIDRALVCFEESDGITCLGHTPEKDAYIGLTIAMAMMQQSQVTVGEYLTKLEEEYGYFCPTKDGITVSKDGDELKSMLSGLSIHRQGTKLKVGQGNLRIKQVLDIDGYKFVFEDDSWLMIRPSGTEPKVRFYVEAGSEELQVVLLETARNLLAEVGLV